MPLALQSLRKQIGNPSQGLFTDQGDPEDVNIKSPRLDPSSVNLDSCGEVTRYSEDITYKIHLDLILLSSLATFPWELL